MKNLILLFFLFALGVSSAFAQEFRLLGKLPAPELKLTTLDGKTVNTADLRGKIVVYNFWFIGCPPCMEEIPKLNEIVDEFQGKDVIFLALATNNKADLNKFLQKKPFKYQIISDAAPLMLAGYGEADKSGTLRIAFPTHIVVNRQGFVEVKVTGIKGLEDVKRELRKQFETTATTTAN